jgi:glycosyltransferase involved in cell wall biosynthesis
VRLSIVGRAPTPAVQSLAAEAGVEVTGRVDDVRPFMDQAAVYIVPLRIGGGTRLKIFEAMAMGKAVVSTTVGAEGLPVVAGEHALIADEPIVRARMQLVRDRDQRERLGEAARACARPLRLVGGRRRTRRTVDANRSGTGSRRSRAFTPFRRRPVEAGAPVSS